MKGMEELLNQINDYEFTLIDINLFLDTHPSDKKALADYNTYATELAALKNRFIKEYGPLQNFGNSTSEGSWKWNTQTWPWDK